VSMMMQTARAPYRPDPNQGDPGLRDWWRAGKRALGVAARTALGMTGFGGAATAMAGAAQRAQPQVMPLTRPDPQAPIMRPMQGTQVMVPKPGVVGAIQRFVPGGFTGTQVATVQANGACPTGHRPNKTSYFLKDGTFVPKGTRCVKRRQRNPMNPRALSRAIGRVDAGKRFQSRMNEISTAKYTASGKRRSCNGR
jgi:hypothetical protein